MKRILPVIVIAQFFCTSVWFAGNAVMADIAKQLQLPPVYLAHLTSAVQLGFIAGTLVFAVLSIADRFSPVRVFFTCAVIAALINLGVSFNGINLYELLSFRFITGFFLAGIYPVGMKIASDHYQQGLGRSLGFLVGALVLGTSFPHLLKGTMAGLPWRYVIFSTSLLAAIGGLAMLVLVPDGPHRKQGQQIKLSGFLSSFSYPNFRAAAFGYFGHMWELYAFWVFVPVILSAYKAHYPAAGLNIPVLSFFIIAAGSLSCVFSGLISQTVGVKRTATIALSISCICCIISPLLLFCNSVPVFIADSPLFSTLVAQNAPVASRGTALTIVNCIGFAITIISIQLVSALRNDQNMGYIYVLLALGPILGLIALRRDR